MTESELRSRVIQKMTHAELANLLDTDLSQFLWVGDNFFAEIVLKDASKQSDTEQILRQIASDLRSNNIVLEVVVRSIWLVTKSWYSDVARTPEGGIKTALDFRSSLKSGTKEIEIRVDVSIGALNVLRPKLGKENFVMHIGWSPEKGDVNESDIAAAVTAYLEMLLHRGGTSYWDPLLENHLELNQAGMSYVLGHSTAFQELHTAITDAFSSPVRQDFLKSLSASNVRIKNFERVLPELSNMLGGAYRRGQTFSVSATDLFTSLTKGEQELIKSYFLIQTQNLAAENPDLSKQFREVF
jgi:hypothetical protein